jgi:hypothetical protein
MNTFRYICGLLIYSFMLLTSGCTLNFTWSDGPIADDKTSVLPDPKDPNGQDPNGQSSSLDDAQEARRQEAERYTIDVIYQGATITQAIQLPSGDIIDGLDRNTLPDLPYGLPALPWGPEALQLPPGVEFGVPDFEQYPELADLVATAAPVERPDFSEYIMGQTDAVSIEDYLDRYQVGGAPSASEHLYAGLVSEKKNRGVSGYMNQFHPDVEQGTFSLMEFAVACPAGDVPAEEMIGIVISVDKLNRIGRGGEPRLHIEYATRNPNSGEVEYNWDNLDGKFVLNPFRRHRPGEIVPVSELGGKQVEHLMGIYQAPVTGDWWLIYKDDLLGYYPADLFILLHAGACKTAYYGEVAWRKPVPPAPNDWPETEMGSGYDGSAGELLAAYVRTPQYYDPDSWFAVDAPEGNSMKPQVVECYSRTSLANGKVFLGGRGGKATYCISPFP